MPVGGVPGLKPGLRLGGAWRSPFCGGLTPLRRPSAQPSGARPAGLCVQASRVCDLTGKRANNGFTVSFSHKRNKKLQHVNLQYKQIYWPQMERMVRLRVSTKAIKTIEKKGLQTMAKEVGLDLMSLPYIDCSSNRQEWLAKQPKVPAQPKKVGKARRMKNPEKLAASTKRPLKAAFLLEDCKGGRVILTRDPRFVKEYQE